VLIFWNPKSGKPYATASGSASSNCPLKLINHSFSKPGYRRIKTCKNIVPKILKKTVYPNATRSLLIALSAVAQIVSKASTNVPPPVSADYRCSGDMDQYS
jgi:hypothetical protein